MAIYNSIVYSGNVLGCTPEIGQGTLGHLLRVKMWVEGRVGASYMHRSYPVRCSLPPLSYSQVPLGRATHKRNKEVVGTSRARECHGKYRVY